MLERPAITDQEILACVQDEFGLRGREIVFLPLGADMDTAVFQLTTYSQEHYFLKLRSGPFKEISATLPCFLHEQGIEELIPLYPTKMGALWTHLAKYRVMLFPFIEGHDAYDVPLTDLQWQQFGSALRAVHTAVLPPSLAAAIPQETYSSWWRETVAQFMQQIQEHSFGEPVAHKMAAFLNEKQEVVAHLCARTTRLAQIVKERPQPHVLCHSDIHAWNLLISQAGTLYIVDWDDPILAPKERDLMFIGAGLGNVWRTPREEALFYEGYGATTVDQDLLAYYRCERIIQDIAAYCEQIFLSDEGGADREEALRHLASNFLPDSIIHIAMNTGRQTI